MSAGKLWVTPLRSHTAGDRDYVQGQAQTIQTTGRFADAFYAEGATDPGVIDVTVEESEGQEATVTWTRRTVGLKGVLSGADNGVTVLWSPTGKPEDARLMATGRVESPPSGILSGVQTWTATCSGKKTKANLLAYVKAVLADAPYVDDLASDFAEEDYESYLLARPGFLHVDPRTHRISLIDELRGDRTVDLTDVGFADDGSVEEAGQSEFGAPVSRLETKVVIRWTQSESGRRTLAVGFTTLDPGVVSSPSAVCRLVDSEGWTLGDGVRVSSFEHSVTLDPGTVYAVMKNDVSGEVERRVRTTMELRSWTGTMYVPLDYTWAQDREEVFHGTLNVPVAGALAREGDEVTELSVLDPFQKAAESAPAVWTQGTQYAAGDRMTYGGKIWRALVGHTAITVDDTYIYRSSPGAPGKTRSVWAEVPATAEDLTPASASFFQTKRGQRLAHHAMLRLVKEARRRLRVLRVRVRCGWVAAADVTMRDSVRIRAFDGVGSYVLEGKVCRIERHWPGDGTPSVVLEIGVSFGVGTAGLNTEFEADIAGTVVGTVGGGLRELLASNRWIRGGSVTGDANVQLLRAQRIAERGGDVRQCTRAKPTQVRVAAAPLRAGETFVQNWSYTSVLKDAPKGVIV